MLERLLQDNLDFTKRMRAAHKVCEDANDSATTSILEIFIDESERRAWFLFETQAGLSVASSNVKRFAADPRGVVGS